MKNECNFVGTVGGKRMVDVVTTGNVVRPESSNFIWMSGCCSNTHGGTWVNVVVWDMIGGRYSINLAQNFIQAGVDRLRVGIGS